MLDLNEVYSVGETIFEGGIGGVPINVVYNPPLLRWFNVSLCALYKDATGNHQIIVDDAFLKSPKFMMEFFIRHEYGHYIHGDLRNADEEYAKSRISARLNGEILPEELAADKFAADSMGPIKVTCVAAYLMFIYFWGTHVTLKRMVKAGLIPENQVQNEKHALNEFKVRACKLIF